MRSISGESYENGSRFQFRSIRNKCNRFSSCEGKTTEVGRKISSITPFFPCSELIISLGCSWLVRHEAKAESSVIPTATVVEKRALQCFFVGVDYLSPASGPWASTPCIQPRPCSVSCGGIGIATIIPPHFFPKNVKKQIRRQSDLFSVWISEGYHHSERRPISARRWLAVGLCADQLIKTMSCLRPQPPSRS